MPQVSLYVDNVMMKSLREDAAREGVSLSKHVARRLRNSGAGFQGRCDTPSGMPEGFFGRFYGCISDDTFVRSDELDASLDAPRLAFD